jgi:hypothetical protein
MGNGNCHNNANGIGLSSAAVASGSEKKEKTFDELENDDKPVDNNVDNQSNERRYDDNVTDEVLEHNI